MLANALVQSLYKIGWVGVFKFNKHETLKEMKIGSLILETAYPFIIQETYLKTVFIIKLPFRFIIISKSDRNIA